MCQYCENDKRKKRNYITNNPLISLRILRIKNNNDFDAFEILSLNRENNVIDTYKIINYCPMCGRKLGGLNNE